MHHHFHYNRPGHNLEMSELNACFGRFSLSSWHEQEVCRKNNYRILYEALDGLVTVETWRAPKGSGSPFVFPLALRDRPVEKLSQAMARKGVEVRSLMGGVIVDQPAYTALSTTSSGIAVN